MMIRIVTHILTVGLVFEDTVLRADVLYIVKRPFSLACLPLADVTYRKCSAPFFDPSGNELPLTASLNPPDLFGSKS